LFAVQYGADLVAMVTSDNDVCGIAWLFNNNARYGYSVTNIACLAGSTFAHELGHNQGCNHNVGDTNAVASYGYGWRRCVMGYVRLDYDELV
jgi:hypothetical protein